MGKLNIILHLFKLLKRTKLKLSADMCLKN